MPKKKIYIILISSMTILIIALGSIAFHYYQKDKQNRELFINHFYFYVQDNETRLKNLLENKPTGDRLDQLIRELEIGLNELTVLLESSSPLIDSHINIPNFYLREVRYILTGIDMSETVNVEIPPFTDDGRLDDNEIALLNIIWEDFNRAKQELYSEKLMEPNAKLTVNDINNIINTHFSKRVSDIYKDVQD